MAWLHMHDHIQTQNDKGQPIRVPKNISLKNYQEMIFFNKFLN